MFLKPNQTILDLVKLTLQIRSYYQGNTLTYNFWRKRQRSEENGDLSICMGGAISSLKCNVLTCMVEFFVLLYLIFKDKNKIKIEKCSFVKHYIYVIIFTYTHTYTPIGMYVYIHICHRCKYVCFIFSSVYVILSFMGQISD